VTERFSAEWLALREPFDHAARSVALARRFADRLPARRPGLMDIGAGTGSLFRFLAPIIGRGQDWVLVDADAALLDEAFGRTAAWARRGGFAATAQGDELLVSTPQGLWRMTVLCTPRPLAGEVAVRSAAGEGPRAHDALSPDAARRPLPQAGEVNVDGVVCSALLDLMSARQLSVLCDTLRVPFLACLTVDGRDAWRPRHPDDALVRAAFHRDMRRDKGFGPALGVDAARFLMPRASASAPSDWHIPRTALAMQRALIDGTTDAARNALPAFAGRITTWQQARLRHAMAGRLAITIGHRDILVPPPGG
jgi:hypothetical protein